MWRNRTAIKKALTKLYQLLEQYAPSWYTQEHREMAERALARSQGHPLRAKTGHGILTGEDEFRPHEVAPHTLTGAPTYSKRNHRRWLNRNW